MTECYGHPDILIFGPKVPRTLLFCWSWDVAFGAPAGPCEKLVEQYPAEVDRVIKDWAEIPAVSNTLRAIRARIAARAVLGRNRRRKAMNPLPASATDEEIASELKRILADNPDCPPDVRNMVLGALHDNEIKLHATRTKAARKSAAKALDEIERLSNSQ